VVSCFDRKMRHGWKQMICHTTKTKKRCRTHHRQAIFNCAVKKYSCENNVHTRAWLTSRASPLVYNAIIFVWLELLACHTKWKYEQNVDHSTSTRGRLASTRDVTCDLYHIIYTYIYVHTYIHMYIHSYVRMCQLVHTTKILFYLTHISKGIKHYACITKCMYVRTYVGFFAF